MLFPERRQHVRIVTLRNFGWLSLAVVVVFAAISIRSELRGRNMHDYGRLVDRQLKTEIEPRKPVEVIEENAPAAAPRTQSEPMIIIDANTPPPQQSAAAMSPQFAPPPGDGRVAIVGGPEGVTVVRQPRRRPLLSGGFGR